MTKAVYKIRFKKGDSVVVRAGKFRGKTGKISKVHTESNMVSIDGINVMKKHKKPTQASPQGGIIEVTMPLPVSKVGLYDATKKKPSKVGFKINKDGSKSRIYKTSGREVK